MRALLTSLMLIATAACAEDAAPKAVIAVVGELDQFNIGQDGYCGKRSDIASPAGAKFKIPANQQTFFYVRSIFRAPSANYTCEGDFSFLPQANQLYMIRYTFQGQKCLLEMFQSEPGATPTPAPVTPEQPRSCLGK